MKWRYSDHVIILHYPRFSCGKFLSNVLSYNSHAIPQFDATTVTLAQATDANFKHTTIIRTIPPSEEASSWTNYELGCFQFWGFNSFSPQMHTITGLAEELVNTDYYTFIMSHSPACLVKLKDVLPNAKVVQVINDSRLNALSQQIKSVNTVQYDPLPDTGTTSFHFDMGTIFDRTAFFNEVARAMEWLDVPDKLLDDRVLLYYHRYVQLYKDLDAWPK